MQKKIDDALDAHARWKIRLKDAIKAGGADLNPAEVRLDNRCDFGKWLHGSDIPAGVRASTHYATAVRLHAAFHQAAADVVDKVKAGDHASAESSMKMGGAFSRASAELSGALSTWKSGL